jgi:ABC-type long-subunit fatty acid transport system fused permease/ATPase subunit
MGIKKTVQERINWGRRFVIFLLILAMFIGGIELLNLPIIGNVFGVILLAADIIILLKWESISERLSKNKTLKKIDKLLFGVEIEDTDNADKKQN